MKVSLLQLYRSIGPKSLLVNKIAYDRLISYSSRYLRGRLIDIGCGEKPLQKYVSHYIAEHVGVDHEGTFHDRSKVDRFGSAYNLPFEAESFDSALCTAVLEHLEEPELAIRECFRVLKPGGFAIYSVPFIWHLHEEPRDFFRYSRYGLDYLFKKAGFEVVEIEALSGFWATFGQLLVYNIYRLNRGPLRLLRIIDAICIPLQYFFYLLDRMDKTEQWTWSYIVVARKNPNK